jgi:hypothetical protein
MLTETYRVGGSQPRKASATGMNVGAFGWLGLPVWPLVLARWVFRKPLTAHLRTTKETS